MSAFSASSPSPFWHPGVHADRRPFLIARGRIVAALRRHFESQGFLEVDCGALQTSPGNEAHLHALRAELTDPAGTARSIYLHTSPEFACKKLLAAGERKIFNLAHVFRARERGALHAPEFTMLEWYRAEETYESAMDDAIAVLRLAAEIAGARDMVFRGHRADPFAQPERVSVDEAFARHARIDLLATLSSTGVDTKGLKAAAEHHGIHTAADDTWSDLFSRILVERVEPKLGIGRPTLLYDYPAPEAALARTCARDLRFAERFELYVCGVELANGFGELTDPKQQRARFEAEMAEKQRVYGERYPIDEDFLDALAQMPQASGVALGLDRLILLATGATHIDQVIWTPMPPMGDG